MTKPFFHFVLNLLCLGASVCAAQSDPWEYCPPKRSLLVLEGSYGSMAIPLTTESSSGPGFGMEGYYLLDRHWMAGLGFGYFDNYVNGNDFNYIDLMLAVRYRIHRTGSGPYLMAGTGLLSENFRYKYDDLYASVMFERDLSYPYVMAGAGWEYEMMKYTDLFVQLQARMIFQDNDKVFYFPLEAGINFGL